MTNWDKFKEVFGIPENSEVEPMEIVCGFVKCVSGLCTECPIYKANMHGLHFWKEEYESYVDREKANK